jgi:rfaE bifunctional protein nucleotidyltransferase chain/domain
LGQVVTQGELILHRGEWKRNGKRVVFISGVFDVLHPGHIRLVEQARDHGEILVLAVQCDASVQKARRSDRGPRRPVTPAAERAEILAALEAVDYVVEFDGATPRSLLSKLQPDRIVKGAPITAPARGHKPATARSAKTVSIPLEPGYSTSLLLERIHRLPA